MTWLRWISVITLYYFSIKEKKQRIDSIEVMMSFFWLFSFLTRQKIMLSSSRGQDIFENLWPSRQRATTRPSRQQPGCGRRGNNQGAPGPLTNNEGAPGGLTNDQRTPGILTDNQGAVGP